MQLNNYLATSIFTPLDTEAMIPSEKLEESILKNAATLYHGICDLEKRETFVQYAGLARFTFNTVHFDFDSKDDGGAEALIQVRRFCKKLEEENIDFIIYCSGNKGFHVAIHATVVGLCELIDSNELKDKIKSLYDSLKLEYSTLDTSLSNVNHKIRAYNSRHEKSSLFKIRLTKDELENSTLIEIKEKAKYQQNGSYVHPRNTSERNKWLTSKFSVSDRTKTFSGKIREINEGQIMDDPVNLFKNFKEKKCINRMFTGEVFPQFNRHDLEIILITELRNQGYPIAEVMKRMIDWADKVYNASETDRIKDIPRQVNDVYSKDLSKNKDYKYGCYGDIKKAYCSAKCKIYNALNAKHRAQPLDVTAKQSRENQIKDNPNLDLSEGELADLILSKLSKVCKSYDQFFIWDKTYWRRIEKDVFKDRITKMAIDIYANKEDYHRIVSLVFHIIGKIQMAPTSNNFFSCSPNKFNFLDGTVHVEQEKDGRISLCLKPHDHNDLLAYCAPFSFKDNNELPVGTYFTKYMEAREKDMGLDGVRTLKQILGAALIPFAPRIFFIEGITNSGKSTIAKLIIKLLGVENVSSSLPIISGDGGDRFRWENTIGKIANIVLELPRGKELDVNTLKMVRDKEKIEIDRKNKPRITGTLPFLHIYCCNNMPASLEGNTGALNNRVSMLYFKPDVSLMLPSTLDLAESIWLDDAASVLRAAREGLEDLVQSGFKYFESAASKNATIAWQKMYDSVSSYFDDINSGEWKGPNFIGVDYELGSLVYRDYIEWCKDVHRKTLGKKQFYNELRVKLHLPNKLNAEGGERFNFNSVINRKRCDY